MPPHGFRTDFDLICSQLVLLSPPVAPGYCATFGIADVCDRYWLLWVLGDITFLTMPLSRRRFLALVLAAFGLCECLVGLEALHFDTAFSVEGTCDRYRLLWVLGDILPF